MKKVIFAGLLLGAAVALQAQVTIGGSVDMSVVPFQFVEGLGDYDNTMGAGIGGVINGGGPRIRLDARGAHADHNIGMRLRVEALAPTSGAVAFQGENFLQAWWGPLDWLRIDAGRFDDDRLRGRIGDDEMGLFTNMMFNQDAIFNRLRMRNGFMLSATPIEGLLLVGALRELVIFENAGTGAGNVNTVANRYANGNAWRNMTFAVGYTIQDIGTIRAQFIGDGPTAPNPPTISRNNDIGLAFALTAVEGLLLDLGCSIRLFGDDDRDADFGFSLGARFRADALEIIGRVDTQFDNGPAANPFRLNAHIWPSFQLDAARVIFNFGINFQETYGEADNLTDLGFGLSLQRNFVGNTRVRGGVALAVPMHDNRPMVFTVPLFLEYSF